MNATSLITLGFLLLVLRAGNLFAQDETTNDVVTSEFKSLSLINTQTTRTVPLKSFALNIQHRFGKADVTTDPFKNFLGFDLASNIRFGFEIPVTANLYVGIGRSNYNRTVDAEAKYTILHQTESDKIPVFLSIYHSTTIRTYDLPSMSMYDTTFRYKGSHRLAFFTQLIASRKFSPGFSMLVAPAWLHRNLVETYEKNDVFVLPIGGKLKTTFQTSVIFEYTYIHDKIGGYDDVYAVGFEIATAGHSFQVTVSNNNRIPATYLYASQSVNPFKGQFYIGFNIHRTFFLN